MSKNTPVSRAETIVGLTEVGLAIGAIAARETAKTVQALSNQIGSLVVEQSTGVRGAVKRAAKTSLLFTQWALDKHSTPIHKNPEWQPLPTLEDVQRDLHEKMATLSPTDPAIGTAFGTLGQKLVESQRYVSEIRVNTDETAPQVPTRRVPQESIMAVAQHGMDIGWQPEHLRPRLHQLITITDLRVGEPMATLPSDTPVEVPDIFDPDAFIIDELRLQRAPDPTPDAIASHIGQQYAPR